MFQWIKPGGPPSLKYLGRTLWERPVLAIYSYKVGIFPSLERIHHRDNPHLTYVEGTHLDVWLDRGEVE